MEGDALAEVLALIESAPELSIVVPDAAADADLQSYLTRTDILKKAVIGTATEDLCLKRISCQ